MRHWGTITAIALVIVLAGRKLGASASSTSGDSIPGNGTAPVRLRVRVLESNGLEPIRGALVKLAGTARGSVTGPPGLAVIPNIAPGPVHLHVYFFDGATRDTTVFVTPQDTSVTVLAPPRPDRWIVDRDPTGYGRTDLFVFVRSRATGRPVKGITVYVKDAFGQTRRATANRRGRATFKQVQGRDVPVWTRDTLGFQGRERFMALMEVRATRDTLYVSPLSSAQ